ncbi:MAG: hydrogenase formation protein HypD [Elusimicrobiales bacterium]|nr:hydrogenase formation protein HypD [Elusimicrobiales bacterium]
MSGFELQDAALAAKISAALAREAAGLGRAVSLMEVCGTHTMAIARHGLRRLLPPNIRLLSGPGCPVCVSAQGDIDRAVEISRLPGVITASFGDMLRVRGTRLGLDGARSAGADVRVVYSPSDAVAIARQNPGKNIVFIGAGFETTAPAIAAAVLAAQEENLGNFFVLPLLKLVPPALRAILSDESAKIDGFLLPGHVSAVIGVAPYRMLESEYKIPSVIAGFEPVEILHAVTRLAAKIKAGDASVENAYRRAVPDEGNPAALELLYKVFEPANVSWRAIGKLPGSGLMFRAAYGKFDAAQKFNIPEMESAEPPGCLCGAVLTGRALPPDCGLFGKECTPADAVGPCMVSSEGSCAAWYNYGG